MSGSYNTFKGSDEIFGNGTGDFPEDFQYENGNYINDCYVCGQRFMGGKHRTVCKLCLIEQIVVNKREYERLLDIEKKYKKLDEWYWSRELST